MNDIDWDLNLIKEIKNANGLQDEQDNELDLMLQPITTQENFNLKHKLYNKEAYDKNVDKQIQKSLLQSKQTKKAVSSHNNNIDLNQESMKFRQYLSEKVEQLRKSKGIINLPEKKPSQSNQLKNKKSSTLRNIINQQQSKQKQLEKPKIQTSIKKTLEIQSDKKSIQTPTIMPPLKPSFSKINKQTSDMKNTRKLTIDAVKSEQNVQQKDGRKTPESKNSFRIKRTSNVNTNNHVSVDLKKSSEIGPKTVEKQSSIHQGKSKKLRQELTRLNEKQLKLQEQIFFFHKENKDFLEKIMTKYQISTSAFEKYGIAKDVESEKQMTSQRKQSTSSPSKRSIKESKIEKTSQKKIKQQANQPLMLLSPLKKQQNRNIIIESQIQKLNNLLKLKGKEIDKLETKIVKNAYIQFLKQLPQDIMQELQQDEDDVVQELPQNGNINNAINKGNSRFSPGGQLSSTYSSVMSEMKSKKWGLKQRITFQTHRSPQQPKSDKKQSKTVENFGFLQKKSSQHIKNQFSQQQYQNDQTYNDNRIQVNSRLKNLLFD